MNWWKNIRDRIFRSDASAASEEGAENTAGNSALSGEVNIEEEDPSTKATTVKNTIVLGALALVGFFGLALIFSNLFSSKKQVIEKPVELQTAGSKQSNLRQQLPSNYGDISKYQKPKKALPKPAPQQQAAAQSPAPVVTEPVRPVPQAPVQQYHDKVASSSIAFKLSGAAPAQGSSVMPQGMNSRNYSLGSFALHAGTIIPATLLTGATSDSPNGDVVAQVRQNVYDSLTGRHLLIPQGSRLIGTSGSAGSRGNKRLACVFTRIILPNGQSINLPEQKGIDGVGYPGLSGKYDTHSSTLYRTAFLGALLAAAAQSATGNTSGRDYRSPGEEAVSGAVASVLDTAKSIVDREAKVQPTIDIPPGTMFSVFINRDFSLGEYVE